MTIRRDLSFDRPVTDWVISWSHPDLFRQNPGVMIDSTSHSKANFEHVEGANPCDSQKRNLGDFFSSEKNQKNQKSSKGIHPLRQNSFWREKRKNNSFVIIFLFYSSVMSVALWATCELIGKWIDFTTPSLGLLILCFKKKIRKSTK